MRTQTRERYRRRNRLLPFIGGHSFYENAEFIPDDARTSTTPYGKFVKREEWGAEPPLKSDGKLTQPILYVNTVNVFMESEEGPIEKGLKGAAVVRMFQKMDFESGLSDIRSNFIIDEDGFIYEGRGWEQKPGITQPDHPSRNMEYLEICYIGDFSRLLLKRPMINSNVDWIKPISFGLQDEHIPAELNIHDGSYLATSNHAQPLNHPAHYATAKLCSLGRDNRYVSRDALMLPPKGVLYERRRQPKMPHYLPENPRQTVVVSS